VAEETAQLCQTLDTKQAEKVQFENRLTELESESMGSGGVFGGTAAQAFETNPRFTQYASI